MRKIVVFALAMVMVFTIVAPALANDACVCTPWCGKVRSMGYWKNDGVASNNSWMATSWTFATPVGGDYKQIFMNQAIAFHNNFIANPCCNGVAFRDTFVQGPCGEMKSIYDVDAKVHAIIDADFEGFSREEVLAVKTMLDNINNGIGIVVCTPPTNGS